MRYRIAGTLLASLILTACGSGEAPPPAAAPEGRAETRSVRNTEAIGYAGDAIADKVDGALNANDERKAKLDAELEASE
ncbi:MAG TPA: hypothetical protein VGE51_13155 [Fontimonas sp.]